METTRSWARIVATNEDGETVTWDCDARDIDAEVDELTAAGLVLVDIC